MNEENENKIPFWKSTWFLVTMCIVFLPLGITLLWVFKKGSLFIRIFLTTLLGIIILYLTNVFILTSMLLTMR